MMTSYKEKLDQFNQLLNESKIDIKRFRKTCFEGIPDKPSVRSLSWKLLLNYLPLDRSGWNDFLKKQRLLYKQYVEEIVAHPDNSNQENKSPSQLDHPLSIQPDSQWITFFKDNEVLLQIDRDVRRLCPDISFFQHPTLYSIYHVLGDPGPFETLTKRVERVMLESSVIGTSRGGLKNVTLKKCSNEEYTVLSDGQEAHWQVVERLLFIYAKLNPGIAYVQGMNELIGPLYYTFASDPDVQWQEYAEADSFFCFTNLMGEVRDNFIKTLDDSAHGIGQEMNKLYCLLQVKDYELWKDLDTKKMMPQFFAFRWITLLLSQEFFLPDVIRLWDSLFSDPARFDFLIYICCSMLIILRQEILDSDFAVTMKLIQNFPHDRYDMAQIIYKAVQLKHHNTEESTNGQHVKPTGKGLSSRGNSLMNRLSKFSWNNDK